VSGAGAVPQFALAAARESTAELALRERYGLFIGGEWSAADDGATLAAVDPATEATLAHVARGSATDVDRAVRAARRGYDKYWRKLRPAERAKYLFRIARAVAERGAEFALLETLDTGRPIRASREIDLPAVAAHLFYHAGWADKLEWAQHGGERPRALGVVGAIVSSHAPLVAATLRLAPALACGNTVVVKPAEATSLTALRLAQVCEDADLPPGVVNIVTGDAAAGSALVEHPDVDKIAFSGSSETGKAIRRANAGHGRPLSLALGGKAALIVFEDAPFDQALEAIALAIGVESGRAGCSGARLLLQESIAADLTDRLAARIERLRHGDPLDQNTEIGAVVTRAERDRIAAFVRDGVDEGARLVQASWKPPERGFWYPASLFTVQPSHRVAREETAGPVLSIMTFRTPAEAIERANATPYGLSAGLWTSDGALAAYVARRLDVGVVWCNTVNRFDPSAPSGGMKESGLGRDGGVAGLQEYLAR